LNKIDSLESSKKKHLNNIQNCLKNNTNSLENHRKKTQFIYKEFEDLRSKLERQNKIFENEIINKKQENEKVL